MRFIELGYNYGLSVACNRGAQSWQASIYSLLIRFEKNCLSQLVKFISGDNDSVFAADPLHYNWKGNKIIHYKGLLTGTNSLKRIFSQMFLPLRFSEQLFC